VRALILTANRFEDLELRVAYDRLRREGIEVEIASDRGEKLAGMKVLVNGGFNFRHWLVERGGFEPRAGSASIGSIRPEIGALLGPNKSMGARENLFAQMSRVLTLCESRSSGDSIA